MSEAAAAFTLFLRPPFFRAANRFYGSASDSTSMHLFNTPPGAKAMTLAEPNVHVQRGMDKRHG